MLFFSCGGTELWWITLLPMQRDPGSRGWHSTPLPWTSHIRKSKSNLLKSARFRQVCYSVPKTVLGERQYCCHRKMFWPICSCSYLHPFQNGNSIYHNQDIVGLMLLIFGNFSRTDSIHPPWKIARKIGFDLYFRTRSVPVGVSDDTLIPTPDQTGTGFNVGYTKFPPILFAVIGVHIFATCCGDGEFVRLRLDLCSSSSLFDCLWPTEGGIWILENIRRSKVRLECHRSRPVRSTGYSLTRRCTSHNLNAKVEQCSCIF